MTVIRSRQQNELLVRQADVYRNKRRSLIAAGFVFAWLLGVHCTDAATDGLVERFEIAKDGDELTIPVRWKDRELCFDLDTGSARTILDKSFRDLLGEPIGKQTVNLANGEETLEFFRAPELRVGSVNVRLERVLVWDMAPTRRKSGIAVDGIIGMDFLKDFVVSIDFEAGFLELRTSLPPPRGDNVERLFYHAGTPYVIVSVAGVGSESFALDTGAANASCLMPAESVRHLESRGVFQQVAMANLVQTNSSQSRFGYLREFQLAGKVHQDVGCAVAGLYCIGRNLMAQYRMTFDFPNRKVYFAPRKTPLVLDRPDASGLRFARESAGSIIDYVSPTSGAAKEGIQAGDIMLRIDGQRVDDWSLFRVREYLKQDGRTVTLTVKRGEDVRDVSLTLKYRVPYPPVWPERPKKNVKPIPDDP